MSSEYVRPWLRLRPISHDAEVLLGALRVAVVPLLLAGSLVPPQQTTDRSAFRATLAAFAAYAATLLVLAILNKVGPRLALATTTIDIVAVTALSFLSGGAFSEARRAFFLIPILVAFRLTPWLTAAAGLGGAVAYTIQAVGHSTTRAHAGASIAMFVAYMLWIAVAAALLSALLDWRSASVRALADTRQRLLVDVQEAGERERRALAEGLHDYPIQNLLSARHDIEEAAEATPSPALVRADRAVSETIAALRDAIFELHPYLLDEVGLAAAIRAFAEREAATGGFHVDIETVPLERHRHDRLLYSVARELLTNVTRHAEATNVRIALHERNGDVVLRVSDNGHGFSPDVLTVRLQDGHIGLASQRERIERANGHLTIATAAHEGTTIEVSVPS